jgi:hypothetical protein
MAVFSIAGEQICNLNGDLIEMSTAGRHVGILTRTFIAERKLRTSLKILVKSGNQLESLMSDDLMGLLWSLRQKILLRFQLPPAETCKLVSTTWMT